MLVWAPAGIEPAMAIAANSVSILLREMLLKKVLIFLIDIKFNPAAPAWSIGFYTGSLVRYKCIQSEPARRAAR